MVHVLRKTAWQQRYAHPETSVTNQLRAQGAAERLEG